MKYFLFLMWIAISFCQADETKTDRAQALKKIVMEGGKMIDLSNAEARWISRDSILWKTEKSQAPRHRVYKLYHHATGDLSLTPRGICLGQGGTCHPLEEQGTAGDGKDSQADLKLPYLSYLKGRTRLCTTPLLEKMRQMLQGYLVLALEDGKGKLLDATTIQTAGVLDDLYAYEGTLGVSYEGSIPILKIWAPTARSVKVRLYESAISEKPVEGSPFCLAPLSANGQWTGVWEIRGEASWRNLFYLYEVEVLMRSSGKVERNEVTDPYSISLSKNGKRSQLVDLNDPSLKPEGWDSLKKAVLACPEDIVIYELHLRDFSVYDDTVPASHRGTYLAFSHPNSNGMKHLRRIADAGLTHIHLLPVFDIATIEEDRALQKKPEITLTAPDSPDPQSAVEAVKNQDAYNWGYDPHHYMAPEGSYSTDPDGATRVLEFREMVKSLSQAGLRVIMDVVFNHTHSAGEEEKSVLGKIVPDYYYRLDDNGSIQCTSCCPDTASEHKMMEKLILDSLELWAIHYKIDGFRFDLMGHHTTDNMRRVRETLDALSLSKNGVDGKNVYVYGEAWKFGSLDAMVPEKACHQLNTYGLGIGSFNDRIRDSIRGGSPFSDFVAQGFATGLYYDFNQSPDNREVPFDLQQQKKMLLNLTDNIRVGMAGNLKEYEFVGAHGKPVRGWQILYRGVPNSGYTAQPKECINYVSVHDNHTLWDCIQARAPYHTPGRSPQTATLQERVQMQNMAIGIIGLSQGIPLFHAGVDMLRSKSGDSDSYNSGDWFNRLDFSYETNNWGVGLPIAEKNGEAWGFWKTRLADSTLKPGKEHILACVRHFQTILRIRKSSPLFRLRSAEEVSRRVRFLNAERGKDQLPGLIVMCISDEIAPSLDPNYKSVVCAFNATKEEVCFAHDGLKNKKMSLHPELKDSLPEEDFFEEESGTIRVPGRSCVVLCEKR